MEQLTNEQLGLLWQDYIQTRDAELKNSLLTHYLYLVKKIVRRLMPQYRYYVELDDLISSGVMGLMDAIERFKPEMGVKFETYATTRVHGEVMDYLRKQDWAPSSLRKKLSRIEKCAEELESSLGRPPGDEELAAAAEMGVSEVQSALQKSHMFNVVHFEDMLQETSACPSGDDDPSEIIEGREQVRRLGELINQLPEKEKLVVSLHYYDELTMKEIAQVMGVSESRISQIHSKVIAKLRASLKDDD